MSVREYNEVSCRSVRLCDPQHPVTRTDFNSKSVAHISEYDVRICRHTDFRLRLTGLVYYQNNQYDRDAVVFMSYYQRGITYNEETHGRNTATKMSVLRNTA